MLHRQTKKSHSCILHRCFRLRRNCFALRGYKSKNLNFLYWKCYHFDIDNLSEAECKSEFRFLKSDFE